MNGNKERDYYFTVLLCQIAICVLFSALVYLFGNGGDFKTRYLDILNANIDSVELTNAIETLKKHFYTGEIFTVLNIKDNFSEDVSATTVELYDGVGGDDLDYKKATKNASFAPVFTTSRILLPIENGRYTSYFGYRINPINGEYGFHTGIDIAAAEGTAIRAVFNGTVSKTGTDEKAGKYIYLTHDEGFVTFYCHCNDITVEEGTVIRQGETIAFVGSTGYSTGPHLHFEVRKDNIRYNPLWLLK